MKSDIDKNFQFRLKLNEKEYKLNARRYHHRKLGDRIISYKKKLKIGVKKI